MVLGPSIINTYTKRPYLIKHLGYFSEGFIDCGIVTVLDAKRIHPLSDLAAAGPSHSEVGRTDWTANIEGVSSEGGEP